VEGIAEKLGIDVDDPAERNANVPRGREVAPAPVLQQLPKAPPGRSSMGQRMADEAAALREKRLAKYVPEERAVFQQQLAGTMRDIADKETDPTFKSGALQYAEAFESEARMALERRVADLHLQDHGAQPVQEALPFAPKGGSGIPVQAFVVTDPSYTPPIDRSRMTVEQVVDELNERVPADGSSGRYYVREGEIATTGAFPSPGAQGKITYDVPPLPQRPKPLQGAPAAPVSRRHGRAR
jgi:hypothetical protein